MKSVSRIGSAQFGLARFKKEGSDNGPLLLGHLIGAASAVSNNTAPDGSPFSGLVGAFEFYSTAKDADVAAARLYLPKEAHDIIAPHMELTEDEKKAGKRVNVGFCLKISAVAGGFEIETVGDVGPIDTLAGPRKAMNAKPKA